MINPVEAFNSQTTCRGLNRDTGKKRRLTHSEIAVVNACGTSLIAGGVTTAISRNYTSNWTQAGLLGFFGAMLTLFFITPFLVETINTDKINHHDEFISSKSTD